MRPVSFFLVFLPVLGCSAILGIHDVPEPLGDGSATEASLDGTPDASMGDAVGDTGIDVGIDVGPCQSDSGACSDLMIVPAGWQPAIFSTTSTSCPAGFTGSNLNADPQTAAGACTCTATNQSAPTCVNGNVGRANGGGCGTMQASIAVTGGCNIASGTVEASEKLTPAPAGGSCTSSPQANPNKLTETSANVCVPLGCFNDVCAGLAPMGYLACIQTSGDAACPSTGPFKNQHVVGDQMTLDCSGACSTCTASATCTSSSLAFYADTGCSNPITSIQANSNCYNTGVSGQTFGSVQYSSTPSGISYQANGSGAAKVSRTNAKTLCCK